MDLSSIKKITKSIIGTSIALVALVFLFTFRQPGSPPAQGSEVSTAKPATQTPVLQQPIKIGVILPLKGGPSVFGEPLRRAAELAVDTLNSGGGIGGKPVRVIVADGGCQADTAAAAAQQLIAQNGVTIIFGGACTSETAAIAAVAETREVLVLSPSATSPELTGIGKFTFRTAPSDALSGTMAARYASGTLGKRRAAVLAETGSYGAAVSRAFRETFSAAGGTVVASLAFATDTVPYAQLASAVLAAQPDVVFLAPQTPAAGIALLTLLQPLKNSATVLATETLTSPVTASRYPAVLENVVGIAPRLDPDAPKTKAFLDAYQTKYGQVTPFPYAMASMYTQFFLIKDGVQSVGPDTRKLRGWLEKLKSWEGTTGTLRFDPLHDPLPRYAVVRIENGKLVPIETDGMTP